MTMRTRLETLARLARMYTLVEEMHSAELQRMSAAVGEAEQAIEVEQQIAHRARVAVCGALVGGDAVGRRMAETQQEMAAWRKTRLEEIRAEREERKVAAKEEYAASRLKKEQMERVLEEIAGRLEIEEARRMQAVSDDRFLARQRWSTRKMKTC